MHWIKAPDIGPYGISKVTHYLVEVGDEVQAGQVLVELEAAKATHEIDSPMAGVVRRIFVEVGYQVDAGTPLIEIEGTAEQPQPQSVDQA